MRRAYKIVRKKETLFLNLTSLSDKVFLIIFIFYPRYMDHFCKETGKKGLLLRILLFEIRKKKETVICHCIFTT